ncbi:MAG: DUF502 domain-containing protein [Flavobacteriales bacterium]|jgi:uncharacterized membrane protein|nr:DUF502 domain-containing protein [Flavobacteriales bacterium]
MKNIINYFLQGLLYIVPISATIYIVYLIFSKIDGILPFNFPGLGLIVIILLITAVGFIGSAIIASPLNALFQRILNRAPLLKTIYTSVKDMMNTFVGKKKGFSEPVLVKLYENSTIERIGFITNEGVEGLNIKEGKVLVYMPHSYAISGQLFVVEKKNITHIDKSSSDIMKLIISGGVTEIDE